MSPESTVRICRALLLQHQRGRAINEPRKHRAALCLAAHAVDITPMRVRGLNRVPAELLKLLVQPKMQRGQVRAVLSLHAFHLLSTHDEIVNTGLDSLQRCRERLLASSSSNCLSSASASFASARASPIC